MAITAPQELSYLYSYRVIDGEVVKNTTTQVDIGYRASFHFNALANSGADYVGIVATYKGEILRKVTSAYDGQYDTGHGYEVVLDSNDAGNTGISIDAGGSLIVKGFLAKGDEDNPSEIVYTPNSITLTINPKESGGETPDPPTPPTPSTSLTFPSGGRAGQLSNNRGQPVFPITVTDAVFRAGDKKSLNEILADLSRGNITEKYVSAQIEAAKTELTQSIDDLKKYVDESIRNAVLDSWEGSY